MWRCESCNPSLRTPASTPAAAWCWEPSVGQTRSYSPSKMTAPACNPTRASASSSRVCVAAPAMVTVPSLEPAWALPSRAVSRALPLARWWHRQTDTAGASLSDFLPGESRPALRPRRPARRDAARAVGATVHVLFRCTVARLDEVLHISILTPDSRFGRHEAPGETLLCAIDVAAWRQADYAETRGTICRRGAHRGSRG